MGSPRSPMGKGAGRSDRFQPQRLGSESSHGDELPNYNMPPFDGIGANEYIVDVVHDAVDFISTVDTPCCLGAEYLVSYAELRFPDANQWRDGFSVHLR